MTTDSVRDTPLEVVADPAVRYGGFSKGGRHLDFPIGVGGVLGDVMVRFARGAKEIVQRGGEQGKVLQVPGPA